MAQTTICIRIDADLKKDFEQRIPFEITAKSDTEKE